MWIVPPTATAAVPWRGTGVGVSRRQRSWTVSYASVSRRRRPCRHRRVCPRRRTYPSRRWREKHALGLGALRKPETTFWSVRDGESLVGCGAVKGLDSDHAELKSMPSRRARKRSGIASLLLGHIITGAERRGC
ncbi:GNAT family N-acetyltransferase [Streptomyces sp. NPDC007905]|uniref:GNAT family N-acetyltransferase n=1 Tax=Streptomyces sp. NPDC007905 TaxID=3364788 RepID=UPI0036E1D752